MGTDGAPSTDGSSGPARRAAAHLDEDAECLEDPVHCGDARHQHDVHAAHHHGDDQTDSDSQPT
jgi:hypothetical protein